MKMQVRARSSRVNYHVVSILTCPEVLQLPTGVILATPMPLSSSSHAPFHRRSPFATIHTLTSQCDASPHAHFVIKRLLILVTTRLSLSFLSSHPSTFPLPSHSPPTPPRPFIVTHLCTTPHSHVYFNTGPLVIARLFCRHSHRSLFTTPHTHTHTFSQI